MQKNLSPRQAAPIEAAASSPKRRGSRSTGIIDAVVFLIPVLRCIQIHLIGRMSGADVLLLLVFLALLFSGKIRVESRAAKTYIVLCSVWLASQIVTDVVRHTAFEDYARGWSNIGLTIVDFAVLYTLLYGRRRRLILYGWGLALGTALNCLITPDQYMTDDPWKFAYGLSVTWAVLLAASGKWCSDRLAMALALFAGALNMVMGARSLGLFCVAAALYLLSVRLLRKRNAKGLKLKAGSAVAIAALGVLGISAFVWAYQYAAQSGALGDDARQKYEDQSSGKFGFLLGGRVEMLGSLPAIYASPILGHGSWAKDPTYLLLERQAMAAFGYNAEDDISPEDLETGLIPAHSYIFGAWVNAGILGTVFWIWVFVYIVKALFRIPRSSTAMLLPLASFCAFATLWDLIFSPYGAQDRIIVPYCVVLLMSCAGAMAPAAVRAAVGKSGRQRRIPPGQINAAAGAKKNARRKRILAMGSGAN